MCKWLLPILFICGALAGCIKSDSDLQKYKAQAAKDDAIIAKYLQDNGLTDEFQRTDHTSTDTSGVYYHVIQQGAGNDLYTSSTQVTVGDTGRILTSQVIFTQTNDFHPQYVLGQVILGWRLGIPKINKGGIVRLLIPSRYAYGPSDQTQTIGLPPNSVLDFTIQLYDVTN